MNCLFPFLPFEFNSDTCSEIKSDRELWSPSITFFYSDQNSITEGNISNEISPIGEKSSSLNDSKSYMEDQKISPFSDYSNQKEGKNINNDSNASDNKTADSFIKKSKPGRKKKSECHKERPKHGKLAKDNIKRKIQVHYLTFLRNLLNQIINELLYNNETKNIQFGRLNYNFTKEITKNSFDLLKNTSIGDIFKNNLSPKFRKKNLNIDVYNKITQKSEIIKKILDKLYLEFFNVYYLNQKIINLSEYGLNKNIILSENIGFYKDLIKINDKEDEIYHQKIEKCIKIDFIGIPIFVVQKGNK